MDYDLSRLLDCLRVTPVSKDRYRGTNMPGKRKAVYGGQVLAQALSGAIQSVDADRSPHSLHCHFLRAGDMNLDIDFEVSRVRDGGSFSTRQVAALQRGKEIFLATVSFQKPEIGLHHQQDAPQMVPREQMMSEQEFWIHAQNERPDIYTLRPDNFTALDVYSNFRLGIINPPPREPRQHFWLKGNGKIEQSTDHLLVIAFLSDLQFMNTALFPHPYTLVDPAVQAASLDHCLWFYGDIDATAWLYYDTCSPVSGGGRGLTHGYFYNEAGALVACASQEGLMRVPR